MTIAQLTPRERTLLRNFRKLRRQTELKAKLRTALTYEEGSKKIQAVSKADGKG